MKAINRTILILLLLAAAIPPVLGTYFQHKIKNLSDQSTDLSKNWMVTVNDKIIGTFNLPKDLREFHTNNQLTTIKLSKEVERKDLPLGDELFLSLGRIADIDETYINENLIGKTGRFYPNGRWDRSTYRLYSVKKDKIEINNKLEIIIQKHGTEFGGVYQGNVFFTENSKIKSYVKYVNFFEQNYIFLFGLIVLMSSFYFLFVFTLGTPNKYYLDYALWCFFAGVFDISISRILYRYISNFDVLFLVNALSAILGGVFYISFLRRRFSIMNKKFFYIYATISSVIALWCFTSIKMDEIWFKYFLWFPLFLITVFYANVCVLRLKNIGLLYKFVAILVPLSLFNDIFNVYSIVNTAYMFPHAFSIALLTLAFQLANETAFSHIQLVSQVDERTKDLSSALEQLKGLEKMKERFFANVSHDLKTPITIALGAIEDAKGQFKATIGRVLEPADRSLRRLQDMVMSILDNVKAESGTLTLQWKSVKLVEFLKTIVEPYQSICAREGVTLKLNTQGYEGLSVPMDPTKMDRVLENLLSNAFKFTKKTPRSEKVIEVSLKTDQSKVYIYIDDSGIGIPESERQKVFERYFQSSLTNLREHGGSGIGLSFVTEMIELHNGKVSADESPYHGSRFTIELPLSQNIENIQSYRIEDATDKNLRGSLDVEYPRTIPENINTSRMNILTAEDNPEVAQIVYAALKDQYNIYFGENGKRALELLAEHPFDCIISDIEMPVMTGDEFVENARKESKWKSIPIIMLSSHGDEDTIVKLLKLGANDYVQKPFRREILLSRIQAQISAYKGTTWNTKMEKLQELGQLVSGIGHQGKNRIGRVGSNYPLLIKIAKDLVKKLESLRPDEANKINEKIDAVGGLIDKGYKQTVDLFKAIDRYASGSENKTEISIEEVFSDTLTLLEEKIQLKNITVEVGSLQGISFEGYNEFREAILNIVSNAVDAVEEQKGKIQIQAEAREKDVTIRITDNGCGIIKENITHVFEPFFTSKQVGQGTGLGLYIARDAIELKNQGTLTITSPGKDQGVTVQITVPKVVSEVKQDRLTMHNVSV